jgi:hypothetical protein
MKNLEQLENEFNEWLDEDIDLPTGHSFAWLLKTADPAAYRQEFEEWCRRDDHDL